MSRALLVTRPQHDITTYYLYKWSEEVIKKAKEKHISVIDLPGKKSTRKRVIGVLEKRSPSLVFLNGHGSENTVCGHNNEIVLKADDKKAVVDKIIYARSCRSAKILGPKAIAH